MTEGKDILPGAELNRTEIAAILGGAPQGGILPARKSQSVLIYSDPSQGEQYGYYDGWLPDEGDGPVFEYTGQGQRGDQEMLRGNKAIRDHRVNGTALRVFVAVDAKRPGGQVFKYLGAFELDQAEPYYEREAPDLAERNRVVFVFRLRPKDGAIIDDAYRLPPEDRTTIIRWAPPGGLPRTSGGAAETTSAAILPERNTRLESLRQASEPVLVKRREAALCERFEQFLRSQEHEVCRYEIRVKGDPGIMRTDTCDETDLVLYEAKGRSSREHVRAATAQLADYVRHLRPERKRCAVLLPSRPSDDLCDLIESQGFALVYEQGGEFVGWPVAAD
ncbi:hypothetical protein [Glycomyces sp. YM15]|uniref:hypothetical protein n=1 Tax=Glycomyces sp. YM15 TaxID=2800446 RepID=UPI0019657D31|nr:hypothetical protein [Glycomyces sp. YM15]